MRKYFGPISLLLLTCYATNGFTQDEEWEFEGRKFKIEDNIWMEDGLLIGSDDKKPMEIDICVWKKEKWHQWYDAADRVTKEILDRGPAVIFFTSDNPEKVRRVFRSKAHMDEAIERNEVVVLMAGLLPPPRDDDTIKKDPKKVRKLGKKVWIAVGGGLVVGVLITNLIKDDSPASGFKR